jgi:Domain of unknown function DUF29
MERVMATKVRAKPVELYEADFYVWALAQADLLRARRFDALDLENLIEEVEGLADTKLAAVLNGARVVMEHLLKLQFSPATDPRNIWRASVREYRRRVQIDLTPRIERLLADQLPRAYAMARDDAAVGMRDHGQHSAADALPAACPYSLDQITGDWGP